MTLHHFPFHDADGRWHAVYFVPGTTVMHSIGSGLVEAAAKRVCEEANREQRANEAAALAAAVHPADRRIPAGFYTDGDAA